MSISSEQIRDAIGDQAAEWFVRNRDGALDRDERIAFVAWLTTSPGHVAEYLTIAALSRELAAAADTPDLEIESVLRRVNDAGDNVIALDQLRSPQPHAPAPLDAIWPHPLARRRSISRRERRAAAVAAALVVAAGALLWWRDGPRGPPDQERYATRHGEQRTWHLPDNSVLHLNTDTSVTVRFGRAERLVEIGRGQAMFEVAHEPARRFRVSVGTTDVIAVGTKFDVYVAEPGTVVTVLEGRVNVAARSPGARPADAPTSTVQVSAGERVRVVQGAFAGLPERVDLDRSVAWLRRQIVFAYEPLQSVAAEFNRYGDVPIDVEGPALGALPISGVFAADDPESFISFLRTLDGITVDTTPTRIRVHSAPPVTPAADAGVH